MKKILTVFVLAIAFLIPSANASAVWTPTGAVRAVQGEFPWAVWLSSGCGGAVYTPTLILTAASCVNGPTGPDTTLTVAAGSVDRYASAAMQVQSTSVYRAPGYAGTGKDWALVRLASPLTGVTPLKLATDTSLQTGKLQIMGFGARHGGGQPGDYLYKGEIPFVNDAVCKVNNPSLVPIEEFCAGSAAAGEACNYDAGSPAVRRNAAGEWIQVGIFSRDNDCGDAVPGVYTEVNAFHAAICTAAASLGGCQSVPCTATNDANIGIPDGTGVTVDSPITVTGCARAASPQATVAVNIVHTYSGDLVVTLVAPDNSHYILRNRQGGSADNVVQTNTVNLSSETANGVWRLRVKDMALADSGYINSWSITL